MKNPSIEKSDTASEELSRGRKAQMLARWREDQRRLYWVELATAERRGRQVGLQEGRKVGLQEGRKEAFRTLCKAFEVELTAERTEQLERMSLDELIAHYRTLLNSRAWQK